jgi:hypothetical protein
VPATIALVAVVGISQYHHVLDPVRAERDGITLNLLVDQGNGAVPNDWYTAGSAYVTTGHGVVHIASASDGRALESRILRVSAVRCYRIVVKASATDGAAVLAAYDADLTRFGPYTPIPAAMSRASFRVAAPDQRVTLAVAATSGTHVSLAGVRIQRLSRSCTTPRRDRDIGVVLDRLLAS